MGIRSILERGRLRRAAVISSGCACGVGAPLAAHPCLEHLILAAAAWLVTFVAALKVGCRKTEEKPSTDKREEAIPGHQRAGDPQAEKAGATP